MKRRYFATLSGLALSITVWGCVAGVFNLSPEAKDALKKEGLLSPSVPALPPDATKATSTAAEEEAGTPLVEDSAVLLQADMAMDLASLLADEVLAAPQKSALQGVPSGTRRQTRPAAPLSAFPRLIVIDDPGPMPTVNPLHMATMSATPTPAPAPTATISATPTPAPLAAATISATPTPAPVPTATIAPTQTPPPTPSATPGLVASPSIPLIPALTPSVRALLIATRNAQTARAKERLTERRAGVKVIERNEKPTAEESKSLRLVLEIAVGKNTQRHAIERIVDAAGSIVAETHEADLGRLAYLIEGTRKRRLAADGSWAIELGLKLALRPGTAGLDRFDGKIKTIRLLGTAGPEAKLILSGETLRFDGSIAGTFLEKSADGATSARMRDEPSGLVGETKKADFDLKARGAVTALVSGKVALIEVADVESVGVGLR